MAENIPPFKELMALIAAAGYQIISIGGKQVEVGLDGIRFTGTIDLQIAPAKLFVESDALPTFPQIPAGLLDCVRQHRECASQSCPKEKDSCQE
jgi:hypothetical protein